MNGPKWIPALIIITVFQLISFAQVIFTEAGTNIMALVVLTIFMILEWVYAIVSTAVLKTNSPALEFLAFFLTGISLAIVTTRGSNTLLTQFIAVIIGFVLFLLMLRMIANVDRAEKFRYPMAGIGIALLVFGLIFAKNTNGAYNWVQFGGFSFQPSELVKIAFIFVGAATLEKIQTTKNIRNYALFAVVCVALLFLMRDLGTALIFFFTFVILAFMRSGDSRTILFSILAAAMAAVLVVLVKKNYVMNRFATYRHIWETPYGSGMQQTRVLTYSVSGGFLGMGIGQGKLRNIFAATEDLVFGVVCEEWGLIIGFLVAMSYVIIFIHSMRNAKGSRSAFYSIASCAAGALLLFQASLNIFGVTDFLPLTGVTLPFVSKGGSSTVSCWGLLAFIKAADNRTWEGGRS
ncbi:MAG: FtsW/RodA/SpoVE family cell cycle protein [Acutalibacteraceae bacterium]|nr:FtsW/RodA/SpoVE family cell cycle protein [Acutalibacteraceae bacterium]